MHVDVFSRGPEHPVLVEVRLIVLSFNSFRAYRVLSTTREVFDAYLECVLVSSLGRTVPISISAGAPTAKAVHQVFP